MSAIAAATLDPAIATRTASRMRAVVDRCPFEQHEDVHVSFLVDGATSVAPTVHPSDFEPERWSVSGRQTYLLLPERHRPSKLAVALSKGRAGAARHRAQLAHRRTSPSSPRLTLSAGG